MKKHLIFMQVPEEQFIPSMIKSQNVEIDALSGATNSCNGIRDAVKAALGL